MSRIYVNFDGLQDLEIKMYGILDQLSNLQQEIAGAMNRLDWEVSQKRSIDEQISQARRRAARLAHRSEHMLRFVKQASADFMKTDLRCANDLRNLNGYLDSVWKGFLGFGSRLFNDIGSCGMDLISALRQAGFYFMGRVTEFQSAHLGHINTAVAVTSLGVAPLGSYELSGELRGRINAILAGTGSANKQEDEKDTGLLNSINDIHEAAFMGPSLVRYQLWAARKPFEGAIATGAIKGVVQQGLVDLADNKLSSPRVYLKSIVAQSLINFKGREAARINPSNSQLPKCINAFLKITGEVVSTSRFDPMWETHKASKKNPLLIEQIMFNLF